MAGRCLGCRPHPALAAGAEPNGGGQQGVRRIQRRRSNLATRGRWLISGVAISHGQGSRRGGGVGGAAGGGGSPHSCARSHQRGPSQAGTTANLERNESESFWMCTRHRNALIHPRAYNTSHFLLNCRSRWRVFPNMLDLFPTAVQSRAQGRYLGH